MCPDITIFPSENVPKIPISSHYPQHPWSIACLWPTLPTWKVLYCSELACCRCLCKVLHTPSGSHWPPRPYFIVSPSASGLLWHSKKVLANMRCVNMSWHTWRSQFHCGCNTDSCKTKDKGCPWVGQDSLPAVEDSEIMGETGLATRALLEGKSARGTQASVSEPDSPGECWNY